MLTVPLSGTTFGMVVGRNPIAPTPVGGAQFFVLHALTDVDEYAITIHADDASPDDPGTLLLVGVPFPGARGIERVHLPARGCER